ncbi:MAG: GntR family transcriptional regulator [Candidatus Aureabacteria bacterium]|nr:GntR family transcriptional regulator [Candidatus Auribacterota bacterium]
MGVPKYVLIKDYICRLVKDGKLKPGDKVFSESELSKKFSVTEMTARHALESLSIEGAVSRIHGKGTFVAGKGSFGSAKGNLWFVLPEKLAGIEPNPYYSPILWGAEKAARKAGYRFVVMSIGEQKEMLSEKIDMGRVKGVMFTGFDVPEKNSRFLSHNIPVVMVDCLDRSGVFDSVCPDNFSGVKEALRHLVSKGHRKIAHIAGDIEHSNGSERMQAYLEFSYDNGFKESKNFILNGDFLFMTAKKSVEAGFEKIKKCSAAFAANDMSALGTISALKSKGVRVPEDISVIGFDDIDSSKYSSPELTTVRVDKCAMGEAAVDCLLKRISDIFRKQRVVRIKTDLVARNSVSQFSKK